MSARDVRQTSGQQRAADDEILKERERSKQRMHQSYDAMMNTYASQQQALSKRPNWVPTRTKNAEEPSELTVTHVNHTRDLLRAEGLGAGVAEQQTSTEWLNIHSIDSTKLTLKHLVNKGKICRPKTNRETGQVQQHLQFESIDINEFEYKLNLAIDSYTKRIKWLLQGSKKMFGLVKGQRVAVLVDCSDANFGFGRVTGFQDSLLHLLDEQLSKKKSLYLAAFGTDVHPVWENPIDITCRSLDQAKEWVSNLKPRGGCNVLKSLRHVYKQPDIDLVLVILGSVPDQGADVLCEYVAQMGCGQEKLIFTVAYDCNNSHTISALKTLAEQCGGNFHCYATASEQPLPGVHQNQEQIYTGTDISNLLGEIQTAQDVINKIKDMRQGLLGTALVTVMNEISNEVAKLPQSRYLPRPPGHELPLTIDVPQFVPSTSELWLADHGLKAKGLDLYQVLAPNAYSYREEFIPVIRKTVTSQVHGKAMAQFMWHDGSVKNVHVDMSQLFEYQKQLGATVKIYEKRIDWLSSASRKIFGTITGQNVLILVDMSLSNNNYVAHVQHSLRLLLEQQLANKSYFNIIMFGGEVHKWQPTLVQPTGDRLQACWRWILEQQCSGSRNFMGGLRSALENDEEAKHNVEVDGLYLFTSGVPDQQPEAVSSFLEEACVGRNLQLHSVLFNVDDYDSEGAIPSRYANITKTAEVLRTLAHSTGGRFHWFRETGIIESDDIAAVSLEIEKALNFSKKCSLLVENVKKKYNLEEKYQRERELQKLGNPPLPPGTSFKALPAPKNTGPRPKPTALSHARQRAAETREDEEEVPKALAWRPPSAKKDDILDGKPRPVAKIRPQSAKETPPKDPMRSVRSKKSQQAFFYTDDKNHVGAVFRKYPASKSVRKKKKVPTATLR